MQEKLARLGIADEFDLVLHLPLRYEDETHLYPINDVPANKTVQVEGIITRSEIMYRPRRQLVCQIEDGSGTLFMRFLNFYGSLAKAYSTGTRVRLLGEARAGFFGVEMVHPHEAKRFGAAVERFGAERFGAAVERPGRDGAGSSLLGGGLSAYRGWSGLDLCR